MENMEKQKFSESWREAFEEAGVTPPDSVWSTIDLKLENEKMKRRVIYYQRLAAASMLFALLIGAWGIQYYQNNTSSKITSNQKVANPPASETTSPSLSLQKSSPLKGKKSENEIPSNSSSSGYGNANHDKGSINSSSVGTAANNVSESSLISSNEFIFKEKEERRISSDKAFSHFTSFASPQLTTKELPPIKKEEAKRVLPEVPAELMTTSKRDKKKNEAVWLSFGAAAGSYNPGTGSSTQSATLQSASFADANSLQSKPASTGTAYSMGLSVGKKISDRWILQTGINYMNQMIAYTSNFATYTSSNELKASVADYADRNSPVTVTQPYKINSSMEYVSVPLQAGYLIVDRKIGLQLNAGIASDIFLRNTLQDQSGQAAKYSQASGESSPYRAFNWAGLASTELSYKIADHYRISLMPGMRYSFQPSLKSSTATTTPFVLDIGFRFKYIFK
jgi:hypothetical protein